MAGCKVIANLKEINEMKFVQAIVSHSDSAIYQITLAFFLISITL